jgi:predicted O-methyltransferase YrrM
MKASQAKAILKKRLSPGLYSVLSRIGKKLKPSTNTPPTDNLQVLDEVGEPFASALRSMYSGQPQKGASGELQTLAPATRISVDEGLCLYRLCRERKANATLEIGCAYGFSTLFILAALARNAAGRHTAIDPWENKDFGYLGIGATKVKEVGMEASFCLLEEPSALGIPHLINQGLRFDVIFIDGNHRFEYVLVDFALSALVCAQGGLIVFDDMWMPSVRKVVSFVRSNRKDFDELSTPVANISVFQKSGEDQRDWRHFEDFA